MNSRRLLPSVILTLALVAACNDTNGPPPITSYGVRLNGATADLGAATLTLRNIPPATTLTAAPGIVMHSRKSADGQSFSVLVAGDLTRPALITFSMPRASTQTGTVVELAKQDGSLVNGVLPSVVFTAQ